MTTTTQVSTAKPAHYSVEYATVEGWTDWTDPHGPYPDGEPTPIRTLTGDQPTYFAACLVAELSLQSEYAKPTCYEKAVRLSVAEDGAQNFVCTGWMPIADALTLMQGIGQ